MVYVHTRRYMFPLYFHQIAFFRLPVNFIDFVTRKYLICFAFQLFTPASVNLLAISHTKEPLQGLLVKFRLVYFQRAVRFAISNATNRLNQLDRLAAQIIAEENLEIPLFFRFVATGMESRQQRRVVKTKRRVPTTFPVAAHHVLVNKLAGR